jgi:hypothetical protein
MVPFTNFCFVAESINDPFTEKLFWAKAVQTAKEMNTHVNKVIFIQGVDLSHNI